MCDDARADRPTCQGGDRDKVQTWNAYMIQGHYSKINNSGNKVKIFGKT